MKTVLVTGASGNLGRAVVQKFLEEGFQVVGTVIKGDIVPVVTADARFEAVEADLLNETATAAMVEDIIAKKGRVEVAVLTVGGFAMGSISETGSADIRKQYQLNFETAYHVARPLLVHMLQQGHGRLFLIGARPGMDMQNGKGMTAYALSKSLIFRLAELMNEEASGTDVVTSVVVPSTIDTPQNRKAMPEADFSKWLKPEEIAAIIYTRCSKGAFAKGETVIQL